jgi:hypothetical protein
VNRDHLVGMGGGDGEDEAEELHKKGLLLSAVKFGADSLVRASETQLTDEQIDAIIDRSRGTEAGTEMITVSLNC